MREGSAAYVAECHSNGDFSCLRDAAQAVVAPDWSEAMRLLGRSANDEPRGEAQGREA